MSEKKEGSSSSEAENKKVNDKTKVKGKGKPGENEPEELSEEDKRKKEELELLVTRSQDENPELQAVALSTMAKEIQTATSSMTSVPKPLKFLRPHFQTLKTFFNTMPDSNPNKKSLADILAVLAITMGDENARESLRFKIQGNISQISPWGHEFIRNLSGEIGAEYNASQDAAAAPPSATPSTPATTTTTPPPASVSNSQLLQLVDQIIPFNMTHNAEPEACDLLMEVEQLPRIIDHVDTTNFERVCAYLIACSSYVPEPTDTETLKVALDVYKKMEKFPEALRVALRLNDKDEIRSIYGSCYDKTVKSQLAFILARQNLFEVITDEDDPQLQAILFNTNLSDHFLALARELNVTEPRTPEDVYKEGADNPTTSRSAAAAATTTAGAGAAVDSARANLSTTFVNAFLNAGFNTDKFVIDPETKWIYKNKEHGMMSAAASLGMILLWNVDLGINIIDPYLYSREEFVKAGALLAIGILHSGVKNESDPAFAVLSEELNHSNPQIQIGAILGLGIAYAGSGNEMLLEPILGVFNDPNASTEVVGIAALALGLIYVGTAEPRVSEPLVLYLISKSYEIAPPEPATPATSTTTSTSATGAAATATGAAGAEDKAKDATPAESVLKGANSFIRFVSLGLGLLYLKRQEEADTVMETLLAVQGELGLYSQTTVETCAYSGTGNVLKAQHLISLCAAHLENQSLHQGIAVLGISLIAMGENLGREMAARTFGNLLQYGEIVIKRSVPLALGFLYLGDPDVGVMDTLSKLSHDGDSEVAQSAIFGLGLLGAGTNNARIGNLLRNLAGYYSKEAGHSMMVRMSQGLLHMGKGTLSLSTYHSNGVLHPVAVAGMLTVLHSMLDIKSTILGKSHYLLYTIVTAIFPRMLMTFDKDLKQIPVSVRVGQAVDTVGQAGRPKTITGFQTHTTPVPIGYGERAELATDEYLSVSSTLEGFVILTPNPNARRSKSGVALRTSI
eukprot:TRINITY_DN5224_c0_g1_i1.p1 TRINITY_DN5224_c0_g1~~TRINITY_DN5224_c0_g1_i1.p1  ORF type:complete len:968 (-),score=277.39 TRINITY_DN5224_c0_g1_i1:82-2985(-)